jgi:CHAT domain-containing protein/tetratricopeptide (TPR) repeat protein
VRLSLLTCCVVATLLSTASTHATPQPPPPHATAPDGAADLDRLLDESSQAFAAREPARGRALLVRIRQRAHLAGLDRHEAEALRRLALDDERAGETKDAVIRLGEALALFERSDDRVGMGRALFQRGALTRQATDLFRAIDLLKAAGDADTLLRAYGTIVYVVSAGPEKDRVRVDALAAARRAPHRDIECNIVHQWGDELFVAGRFAESYAKLTEALACFRETPDRGREGRVLVSLGRLHRAHGRLKQALDHYVRALALQEAARDENAAIQSVNAIAVTLAYLGRPDEAAARYEEAMRRARAIKAPTTNILLGNLGGAWLGVGRYREAIAVLEESLAAENNPSLRTTRQVQLARAWLGLGDPDRAMQWIDRALGPDAVAGPALQLAMHNTRAEIFTDLRRFDQAASELEQSIAIVERLRANTIPTDFMKQGFSETHQFVFGALIDSLQAQARHRDALDTAERARSRAFLDLLATRHGEPVASDAASTTPPIGTATAAASVDGPGPAPAAVPSSRSSPPATVDDIVGAARRLRSTFVCYWVGDASTSIWVVTPEGRIVAARVPVSASKLAALVMEATGADEEGAPGASEATTTADSGRRPVDAQSSPAGAATRGSGVLVSPGAMRRPWRELHRLLIEPVAAALPSAPGSRLTIVPHGVLFRLSFAALRDTRGRYLLESHDLHYVPAAAVLAFTNGRRSAASSGSLLVGDPGEMAGDTGASALAALPWARREVEAVQRLVAQPATVLVGDRAGEADVRAAAAGRSLVHFATHGIVRNDEALTSYLALRPDAAGDADHDGRLTADEVYALSLVADLVVLSACRSALGPTSGDGVIGFTRAFLSAGAASVIATMWDVPDRTSYEVMRRFYQRRAAGAGKGRALRAAQLSLLDALRHGRVRIDGSVLPEVPRLWAGFVLVGEP